ncbi:MAG: CAP domain-containing protein [Bacteriovoracaceae bacterium]|jgi:uncharacterized protein YkwD|nr:CAP domain-containing protein [Bacteriovoracaceae bacterium]
MKKLLPILLLSLMSCGKDISLTKSSDEGFNSTQGGSASFLSAQEQRLVDLVNNHRSSIGKKPLIAHANASIEARDHSRYQANVKRGLTHWGFSARIDRIRAKQSEKVVKSGENVAYNYKDSNRAHTQFINSNGHRKNVEGDFTHIGIGNYTDNNGRIYYTQIFLKQP